MMFFNALRPTTLLSLAFGKVGTIRKPRRQGRVGRAQTPGLELMETRALLSTVTVSTTAASGPGSLSACVQYAENNNGTTIDIPSCYNNDTLALPAGVVNFPYGVTIDGPGYVNVLNPNGIVLQGTSSITGVEFTDNSKLTPQTPTSSEFEVTPYSTASFNQVVINGGIYPVDLTTDSKTTINGLQIENANPLSPFVFNAAGAASVSGVGLVISNCVLTTPGADLTYYYEVGSVNLEINWLMNSDGGTGGSDIAVVGNGGSFYDSNVQVYHATGTATKATGISISDGNLVQAGGSAPSSVTFQNAAVVGGTSTAVLAQGGNVGLYQFEVLGVNSSSGAPVVDAQTGSGDEMDIWGADFDSNENESKNGNGGAIADYATTGQALWLDDVNFSWNTCQGYGGSVYFAPHSDGIVNNVTICQGGPALTAYAGGGIAVMPNAGLILENTVIDGTSATVAGSNDLYAPEGSFVFVTNTLMDTAYGNAVLGMDLNGTNYIGTAASPINPDEVYSWALSNWNSFGDWPASGEVITNPLYVGLNLGDNYVQAAIV